ncbi:hypothetical protein M4I95_07460 [Enterococcus faecium]|uniref:hypothetical protein n=1 Tax=Enterococcus faecium TaxID=1352 RepID=UPI002543109E|nr:hypothetical protein [Enterococcus faecium]EME7112769.1 hypothetical protein [Enterococcus faecium]EME7202759.1 hypothetical protein [Enterococcus faecium]MDK4347212.1 hypothetical protein [Enterococcus faecium]MDK4385530.1 hypothetical protein [Enterococcus faecium]HBK5274452.1 hypothetical protein [Enterococcus faecium]
MTYYLENKVIGKYFRSATNQFLGIVRIYGTYTEYRVIEGVPEKDAMLEIIGVQSGVLLTRVNNSLFENGRGYIVDLCQ